MRIPGLASGLDVDTIVKQMTMREKTRVDKAKQEAEAMVWKQQLYRDIMKDMQSIKDEYFDVLSKNNMLNDKNFNAYKVLGIKDGSGLSITTGSGAVKGEYTVKVLGTAEKAMINGKKLGYTTGSSGKLHVDSTNNSAHGVTIDEKDYGSLADVANAFNNKLGEDPDNKILARADFKTGEVVFSEKINVAKDQTVEIAGVQITLDEGDFTKEELNAQLNKKISEAAKDNEGLKDVKVGFNDDGKLVSKKGADGPEVLLDASVQEKELSRIQQGVITDSNDTLTINVGGQDIQVTLGPAKDIDEVIAQLNNDSRLKGKVQFTNNNGAIGIASKDGEKVSFGGSAAAALGLEKTANGDISKLRLKDVMDLNGSASNDFNFTVNGQEFKYDLSANPNITMGAVMKEVSSKADVKFEYSQLTNEFVISSKKEGSTQKVDISGDLEAFFTKNSAQGKDSTVEVTSPYGKNTVTTEGNTITFDGITIDITKKVADSSQEFELSFSVSGDTEGAVKNINAVVEQYNKMIDKIYGKLWETKNYKYTPLTDEQKEAMSEKEIEIWEKKAKEGLLANDPYIEKFAENLRNSIMLPVNGSTLSLRDIGIKFDDNYKAGPKLVVDDEKLKKALEENGDDVTNLFIQNDSKTQNYNPNLSPEDKKDRFENSGVFQRMNDVFNDALRLTRDNNGQRGYLIEVAGVEGDISNNAISQKLKEHQKRIDEFNLRLTRAEEKYYNDFARLDSVMQKLNAQQAYLMQQFGGGQ